MKEEAIKRINELYRKSKTQGLTNEEKAEQARLRKEYIQAVKNNLKSTLNNVSIVNPDGTVTNLSRKDKEKNKNG